MSYNQDIFIDNCVLRLVQIACAIRQNNDRLERELDSMEIELECQSFDATDNA